MPRKTRCYVCKKEIDDVTIFNSIQHFDHAVCSVECGIKLSMYEGGDRS